MDDGVRPQHGKPTKKAAPSSAGRRRGAFPARQHGADGKPVPRPGFRAATHGIRPKWDAFAALAFKSGEDVDIRAKSGKPLGRFFPEILACCADWSRTCSSRRRTGDRGRRGAFPSTLFRCACIRRQAACRKLSQETPAKLILFDMLAGTDGTVLTRPVSDSTARPASRHSPKRSGCGDARAFAFTLDIKEAERWLTSWQAGATDGVVAKRRDGAYECGRRGNGEGQAAEDGPTASSGGFRYESDSSLVGSLLLGLYDTEGLLNHVGFTATTRTRSGLP